MSRTIRKTLEWPDRANRNNTGKKLKTVPDGKCKYKCRCPYCMSEERRKEFEKIQLNEIKNVTKYLEV